MFSKLRKPRNSANKWQIRSSKLLTLKLLKTFWRKCTRHWRNMYSTTCLSCYLSVCHCVYLSVLLSTCVLLSICLSLCLSVCPAVYLSVPAWQSEWPCLVWGLQPCAWHTAHWSPGWSPASDVCLKLQDIFLIWEVTLKSCLQTFPSDALMLLKGPLLTLLAFRCIFMAWNY